MKAGLALFGAMALVPAMVGPLQAERRMLAAPLCSGGGLTIPVSGSSGQQQEPAQGSAQGSAQGPAQGPCCAKGCHSDNRRRRLGRPD